MVTHRRMIERVAGGFDTLRLHHYHTVLKEKFMPHRNIISNAGFRIAILDINRKTAEIALTYGISESYCRTLRAKYGRRWKYTASYGVFVAKAWMEDPQIVSDVRNLLLKEMMTKYGWSNETVSKMRRELGVAKGDVFKSKEFRDAIKAHTAKEVAEIFSISLPTVVKFRKKFRVARIGTKVFRHRPALKKALHSQRSSTDVAREFGCSSSYIRWLRREMREKK